MNKFNESGVYKDKEKYIQKQIEIVEVQMRFHVYVDLEKMEMIKAQKKLKEKKDNKQRDVSLTECVFAR